MTWPDLEAKQQQHFLQNEASDSGKKKNMVLDKFSVCQGMADRQTCFLPNQEVAGSPPPPTTTPTAHNQSI